MVRFAAMSICRIDAIAPEGMALLGLFVTLPRAQVAVILHAS